VDRILIACWLAGCPQGTGLASSLKEFPQFPHASPLATHFNDSIAASIEAYQAFLKTLGYSPLAEVAYSKKIQQLRIEQVTSIRGSDR